MTTVLGALDGPRAARAGRPHRGRAAQRRLRHPFPEELNRRAASRLARDPLRAGPLGGGQPQRRGTIVDTGSNTIRDSLALVPADASRRLDARRTSRSGSSALHRFELLERPRLLGRDARGARASTRAATPLLFVDHPVTVAAHRAVRARAALRPATLRARSRACASSTSSRCSSGERLPRHRQRRQPGGVLSTSTIPCLVHRERTERATASARTSSSPGSTSTSSATSWPTRPVPPDAARFRTRRRPTSSSPTSNSADLSTRFAVAARTALVTGSSGLIGSEAVTFLDERGWPCTASTTTCAATSSARTATRPGTSSACGATTSASTHHDARHPRPRRDLPPLRDDAARPDRPLRGAAVARPGRARARSTTSRSTRSAR